MSNTRNHHYVSQFYLKGFSKNGRTKAKLFVYDKEQQKYFQNNGNAKNKKNKGQK